MIDTDSLKEDLQRQVTALEKDLHDRLKWQDALAAPLKAKYAEAFQAKRTAVAFIAWAEDQITQSAVAWVLATVFIRFLEDNGLIPDPILSGPQERRRLAQDALSHHFMQHPGASERDYLLHHFSELRQYPALAELLGPHNALHSLYPEGYALKRLIAFWQEIDPTTGEVKHDFTDPEMNTRFLGDLYQDLSASARKTYALLQTPLFVEEFILDRTLTPAIREFGFKEVRMIDPTCGSGHFLLGSFRRLFALWVKEVPTAREAAVNALRAVHGVDLNPFAVAITRFRLIIEACHSCGVKRLSDAPDFEINVAVGDSLLHGRYFGNVESGFATQPTLTGSEDPAFRDELKHHYEVEDVEALHRILGQQYHAVVGNPPYITVKDRAVSVLYRARFPSCHGKYSLAVPFMERFFDLAVKGDGTPQQPAGFVGQITANSFMKRGFGKKIIREFIPKWDLTHVLDTGGAYIPGHGTPTVILLGKNQPPVSGTVRTVMGIKGEPSTPNDPSSGLVWTAIKTQVDQPGSESDFASVADTPRDRFHKHPWSIGGGGAAELKEILEENADSTLGKFVDVIGVFGMTNADDVMLASADSFSRRGVELRFHREYAVGDKVRDWVIGATETNVFFPYANGKLVSITGTGAEKWLWPCRTSIGSRATFSKKTYFEEGRPWWEWHQIVLERLDSPLTLVFPDVATHNHFALDRGGRVFKSTAPIIKLPITTSDERHIELLGLFNSSATGFWLKQVWQNKGSTVDEHGARQRTAPFEDFYQFNCTTLNGLPIPESLPSQLPTALLKTSTALLAQSPAATLASSSGPESGELRTLLATACGQATRLRRQLIAWQEELDWQIYEAFGLVDGAAESGPAAVSLPDGAAVDAIPPEGIELGQRAFEIVLARRMMGKDELGRMKDEGGAPFQTTWFARHGSTPITEVPAHWPKPYRELVERRIELIASDPNIRLIEQPEYKRRWNTEPWDAQFKTAAQNWLLARLETYFFDGERMDGAAETTALRQSWPAGLEPKVFTLAQLVAVAETDPKLKAVMQEYTGTPTFDITRQIKELLEEGSVPYLPAQRYKETGLRKRRAWEDTWRLQRMEDAIEAEIMARLEPETREIAAAVAEKTPGITEEERQNGLESARKVVEENLRRELKERLEKEVGPIPVPPKYTGSGAKSDFRKASYWNLRGKLDVPKERWISYPGLETQAAPSPLFAWAGWNHLQQAQALAALYVERKERDGWDARQLTPLLAGLQELVPWLLQWHNEVDPAFNMKLGDYFADYLDTERKAHGLTVEDIEKVRLG